MVLIACNCPNDMGDLHPRVSLFGLDPLPREISKSAIGDEVEQCGCLVPGVGGAGCKRRRPKRQSRVRDPRSVRCRRFEAWIVELKVMRGNMSLAGAQWKSPHQPPPSPSNYRRSRRGVITLRAYQLVSTVIIHTPPSSRSFVLFVAAAFATTVTRVKGLSSEACR